MTSNLPITSQGYESYGYSNVYLGAEGFKHYPISKNSKNFHEHPDNTELLKVQVAYNQKIMNIPLVGTDSLVEQHEELKDHKFEDIEPQVAENFPEINEGDKEEFLKKCSAKITELRDESKRLEHKNRSEQIIFLAGMISFVAGLALFASGLVFLATGVGFGLGLGLLISGVGLGGVGIACLVSSPLDHTAYSIEQNKKELKRLETIQTEDYIRFSQEIKRELFLPSDEFWKDVNEINDDPYHLYDLYLLNQDIKNPELKISLEDKIFQIYALVEKKLIIINQEISNIQNVIATKQEEMNKEENISKKEEIQNEIQRLQGNIKLYEQKKQEIFNSAYNEVHIPDDFLVSSPKIKQQLEFIKNHHLP